jgi:hypothetical protein
MIKRRLYNKKSNTTKKKFPTENPQLFPSFKTWTPNKHSRRQMAKAFTEFE